jgi:autotransporter-associated beta strand protein
MRRTAKLESSSPIFPFLMAPLLIGLACISAKATPLDDIGVTALENLDPTLTGTGVNVAQVEAPESSSDPLSFEVQPNYEYVNQPQSKFTYYDQMGNATYTYTRAATGADHANGVAQNFYGTPYGVAPGINHIDNVEAEYFFSFINSTRPGTTFSGDSVINQSFDFTNSSPPPTQATVQEQEEVDLVYDDYVDDYPTTIVVSGIGDPSEGTPYPSPPGTAYNSIGVGALGGDSATGPTLDNNRSKPDITAPGGSTSFSTPYVSGAAAILVQAGSRGDAGVSAEANAVDFRTIKALLLNGATQTNCPGWSHTHSQPLDVNYGAGEVNVYNSYLQLKAGEFSPSVAGEVTSSVGGAHPATASKALSTLSGWNLTTLASTSGGDAYDNYVFTVPINSTGENFNATLDWARPYTTAYSSNAINNLDLYLYDVTANTTTPLDFSNSTVDNVQYLYDTGLNPGDTYDVEVLKNGGAVGSQGVLSNSEKYALAFNFSTGSSIAWAAAQGGSWNTAANWSGDAVPNQAGQAISCGNTASAPITVTLDGSKTVGDIFLNSGYGYTISRGSGGSLTLSNNSIIANISDFAGNDSISAPLILTAGVLMTVTNTASTLSISGAISGSGGLTIDGSGTVNLSGSNTYSGTTVVNGGTLVVATTGALPNNANLTVGTSTTTAAVKLSSDIGNQSLSGLSINSGSSLDIADNAVIINYTGKNPESTIQSFIEAHSIISSFVTANGGYGIAYASGNDNGVDDGNLQPNQLVIEPNLLGDAELTGVVNISDLQTLLSNFNQPGFWDQGNFLNHATVDISDLQALLSNFNNSTSLDYSELSSIENLAAQFGQTAIPNPDGTGFTLTAIPEPASAALLLSVASLPLLSRPRNRST